MLSSNPNYHTTAGPGLTPAQVTQARLHSYTLLGNIFQGGVNAALLPYIQAVPFLHDHLSQKIDLDDLAATHFQLFNFTLHPFESIFRDDSGLVGGPITDAVISVYHQAGYTPPGDSVSADHVGQELAFLAFLCEQELTSTGNTLPAGSHHFQHQQYQFLDHHFLRWYPPFLSALKFQQNPFFTATGELTLSLVAHHLQSVTATESFPYEEPKHDQSLDIPVFLEEQQTGLRDIVDYLLTPPRSGIYLGKEDIGRLARNLNLPRGFGDRHQILLNLFHTSAQYEQLPQLLLEMKSFVDEWQAAYQQMIHDFPILSPYVSIWAVQVNNTSGLLMKMENIVELADN